MSDHKWSAAEIGALLVRQVFQRKAVLVCPESYWTGHEADLLCVMSCLRIVDVEIKISRADLKADARKDKWWHVPPYEWSRDERLPGESWVDRDKRLRTPREWPPRVWKHYYCMPAEIWAPELLECLPSSASGVLLVGRTSWYQGGEKQDGHAFIKAERRARPNRDAQAISAADVMDIARLCGLRMWDALEDAERRLRGAA